jgi:rhodanese-related sulfurtransferase
MANYDRIVLVCYSGQTSAFGTALMRLMGYDKVFSLKFGMSSWAATFARDYWQRNIGNAQAAAFVTTATASPPKNPAGALPTLSTGKTTGPEILEARVRALLTAGFPAGTISHATLFANLGNYYIVNYWPLSHYLNPGHIPGAIQYTPRVDLKTTTNLTTLPTNRTIVLYCYTGQTSGFVAAAYLRLLGYDARSLLYGANALIYDRMAARGLTVWRDAEIMNYPFISG